MVYATLDPENLVFKSGKTIVCGVDEVGRGCFAGPVVAGAVVITPSTKVPPGIADSKLLTPKKRVELAFQIQQSAPAFAIAEVSVEVINEVGIGKATQMAFLQAVSKLSLTPQHILIDAFFIENIPKEIQTPIVHGDQLSISIAAASIIAKVYRDALMEKLDAAYPGYGFALHKGYGTKLHRDKIKELGLSDMHRKSFDLVKYL